MDKPEVLVHISTPATRANDDLYRSLADAYIAFEPHRSSQSANDDEALSETVGLPPSARLPSSQGQAPESNAAAPVFTSMDSYGSFPSHLTSGDRSSDQHNSESHEIPSSPEDVSISRLERLEHIQTRWREQRTSRSSLANSRRQSNSTMILSDEDSTFIENTQQAFQAMESQLPDHLSTTSEEASDDDAYVAVTEDVGQDADEGVGVETSRTPFGPSSGNVQNESLLDTSLVREQSTTRKSLSVTYTEQKIQSPSSQHSTISVDLESKRTSQTGHPEAPAYHVDFDILTSMACPPPPTITMISPGTLPSQITPYLGQLKQQNPGRFKPKAVHRALEADERGHWRVDCRLWPKHVQQQFWIFLQKDVESGRLGWGVTLHRDTVRMRLGLVRLYCWGETIEHVWLTLWLHSGGRVWSTGAVWVDSGEIEVVRVSLP